MKKASHRYDAPLTERQEALLYQLKQRHPDPVRVPYRARRRLFRPQVFHVRLVRFWPRTMEGLWMRGLVQYETTTAGDRLYHLTETGLAS